MPEWTKKDERQYEHVKESVLDQGKSEASAKKIAARTVNKQRRQEGRTPNKTTQGTGNPNTSLDERSVDELRNIASELNIAGRSKLKKAELIEAIREHRNQSRPVAGQTLSHSQVVQPVYQRPIQTG